MSTIAYTPMPRPVASPVDAGVTAPGLGALGVGSPGCWKAIDRQQMIRPDSGRGEGDFTPSPVSQLGIEVVGDIV